MTVRDVIALRDPWRFNQRDQLFVRGWDSDYAVTVQRRVPTEELPLSPAMADAITCGFPTAPHYECLDHLGRTWLLCQLELSTSPTPKRK